MLLSWYNEPLKNLQHAIEHSVRAGCTHVIALDGAYASLDVKPLSSKGQHKHIAKTCERLGVPCHVEGRQGLTEVQKRTLLFDLAYEHINLTPEDWLFVMDADQTCEGPDVRPTLKETDADTLITLVFEHDDQRFSDTSQRRFVRHLFRALPGGITVGPNHYTYRDRQGRILWGYQEIDAPRSPLMLHNHSRSRGSARNQLRNAYYTSRQQQRLEPGLHGEEERCSYCEKRWMLRTPTEFKMDTLADGSTELVSDRTVFVCADHAPRIIHENRMTAERIAAGNPEALTYILKVMKQHAWMRPFEDFSRVGGA